MRQNMEKEKERMHWSSLMYLNEKTIMNDCVNSIVNVHISIFFSDICVQIEFSFFFFFFGGGV